MTGFRIIPADDRYKGLTGLRLDDTRELIVMATGKEAERVLLEAEKERGRG